MKTRLEYMLENNVIRKENFTSLADMEYLAERVDDESIDELIDIFKDFADKYIDDEYYSIKFLQIMSTALMLLKNRYGLEENDSIEYWAYHCDTQERKDSWRVQMLINTPATGLTDYLIRHSFGDLKSGGYTLYLKERGMSPYLKLWNGSVTLTAGIKKKQ